MGLIVANLNKCNDSQAFNIDPDAEFQQQNANEKTDLKLLLFLPDSVKKIA